MAFVGCSTHVTLSHKWSALKHLGDLELSVLAHVQEEHGPCGGALHHLFRHLTTARFHVGCLGKPSAPESGSMLLCGMGQCICALSNRGVMMSCQAASYADAKLDLASPSLTSLELSFKTILPMTRPTTFPRLSALGIRCDNSLTSLFEELPALASLQIWSKVR